MKHGHLKSFVSRYWIYAIWLWAGCYLARCIIHEPAPGTAVAVGGTLGALTVLRELTKIDKAIFIGLMLSFVWVELSSIKHEHAAQEIQRRNDEAQLKANFTSVLEEANQDFKRTEGHMETVADRIETVYKNVTGGDSFPVVTPQIGHGLVTKDASPTDVVPLIIWNHGDYPLTGVTVSVTPGGLELGDWVVSLFTEPEVFIPEIEPHGYRTIKGIQLTPRLEKEEVRWYTVNIGAQNGSYTQQINFKKTTKGNHGWPFAYNTWVAKENQPIPGHPESRGQVVIFGRYNFSDDPPSPNNVGK